MPMLCCGPIRDWKAHISQEFGHTDSGISYPWECGHEGIDFAIPIGTPVYACHEGVVRLAGYQKTGYGWVVVVENGELETVYAHCADLIVSRGDVVSNGEPIAFSGNSGRSTGPHLHFGLRVKPWSYGQPSNGFINPIYALEYSAAECS